jgi:hypothetical protein
VFESRKPRRIFGPKRDKIIEVRIVRAVKLRRMKWVGHVACEGARRGVYSVWVGTPEGKRPHGRLRHRWENKIKIDLQEVGGRGMDWIDLAQDRDRSCAILNVVMNLQVP